MHQNCYAMCTFPSLTQCCFNKNLINVLNLTGVSNKMHCICEYKYGLKPKTNGFTAVIGTTHLHEVAYLTIPMLTTYTCIVIIIVISMGEFLICRGTRGTSSLLLADIISSIVKNIIQNLILGLHYLRNQSPTLQTRGGHRPISPVCPHRLEFNRLHVTQVKVNVTRLVTENYFTFRYELSLPLSLVPCSSKFDIFTQISIESRM